MLLTQNKRDEGKFIARNYPVSRQSLYLWQATVKGYFMEIAWNGLKVILVRSAFCITRLICNFGRTILELLQYTYILFSIGFGKNERLQFK